MRNDRQVSMLSVEELAEIAEAMGLDAVAPELVGANIVVEGLAGFSRIPAGAHLAFGGTWGGQGRFDGGCILKVEAYNNPCRNPGRRLAAAHGRPELEFGFVKAARSLRGLVLSVSLPGVIRAGDAVVVVPPAGRANDARGRPSASRSSRSFAMALIGRMTALHGRRKRRGVW